MKNKKEKITRASKKKFTKKASTSFKLKIVFNILLFGLFLTFCLLCATRTLEKEKVIPINYTDGTNITYKVYLMENDIYHEDYLEMNRAYVATLIDYLDIDFNYAFSIEKLTDMDFEYKIIANLIIENQNGTNFVDEDYVLKDSVKSSIHNSGDYTVNENIKIDYHYYNYLANKFRNQTGVDVNSYLNVYMLVAKKTAEGLDYKIDESRKLNIRIPLSERALEIKIDSNNQSITKQIIPEASVIFNKNYLILEISLFIITCIFLVNIIRYSSSLIKEKTPYDKYVNKLLKDYDRLIVETTTTMKFKGYQIIEVENFTELLDVRDNLKLPIIYNTLVEHKKGVFYIKNNTDIYQLIVDGSKLEDKKN